MVKYICEMWHITLKEYQKILAFTRVSQVPDQGFTMLVQEKIYLEVNNQNICLKKTAQLYFLYRALAVNFHNTQFSVC